MATLLISDFRGKQLQHSKNSNGYTFITDDCAEYAWFSNNVMQQLPLYSLDKANIIIMLGFIDCVYSCVWKTFDIASISADYADAINSLIKQYPDFTFYVCSVNPIDTDYPFAEYPGGAIPHVVLDKQIKRFNTKVKSSCSATFIDCYEYLTSTSFNTRDGVRYDVSTCNNLLTYITSNLKTSFGSAFQARFEAPTVDDGDIESDLFWLSTSAGGYNPFGNLGQSNSKCAGDTLPNSTAYAWGRFYEIIDDKPTLSTSNNAGNWYAYTDDGYSRGNSPALGAIMCWSDSDSGHLAVVEQINPDGSLITSESAWSNKDYWWTTTRIEGADGNWGQGSSYTFQGFIYCPITSSVDKETICTKNSYDIKVDEMKPNARYILQYLGARGWTLNAVAGLLGNLQVESKMSPWSWQATIDGSIIKADGTHEVNNAVIDAYYNAHGKYPGYGLVQWTPYYKYTNWCSKNGIPYWDIDSQLYRIEWEVENNEQWQARPSKGFDLSFKDFISSNSEASWLAEAFAFCYERPGSSTGTEAQQNALRKERGNNGQYWFNYLSSLPASTGDVSQVKLEAVTIDQCHSTSATASFIVTNCTTASYSLKQGDVVKSEKELAVSDGFVVFKLPALVPNTDYTLELTASNGARTTTKAVSFRTQQEFPESFTNIVLAAHDTKLPHDSFKLKTVPAKPDFGYWHNIKNKDCGYLVQLIVNNQAVSEKIVKSLQTNFILSDYFNYTPKVGDTIQIGIRTWVQYDGDKLFDSNLVKVSNTVHMLENSTVAYLNIN